MSATAKYSTYKELVVYQKAKALTLEVFRYFSKTKLPRVYEFLINQLLRSISSIGANIAEGYGRHYKKSYRQFLGIARGSCFETEYWLGVAFDLKIFDNEIVVGFLQKNTELIKMLTIMMKKLEQRT